MREEDILPDTIRQAKPPEDSHRWVFLVQFATRALVIVAFCLLVYGMAWHYSSRRYLKGFSDAIVPLDASAQDKTRALLRWFRHEPPRFDTSVEGTEEVRDPVTIVTNQRLLAICGSASNAFINLADAAGLKTRRLLLLDSSGRVIHVVVEVEWGDRWAVVDPQHGHTFKDHLGRALSKEELRDPAVFQEAISRIPGYDPEYNFAHTVHIHMRRIPFGALLRRTLTRFFPDWEELLNWGYFPENPSLWPIFVSIPLLFLGILLHGLLGWYGRKKLGIETSRLRSRLWQAGRALLHHSA